MRRSAKLKQHTLRFSRKTGDKKNIEKTQLIPSETFLKTYKLLALKRQLKNL